MGWAMVERARLRELEAWNNGTTVLGITPETSSDITAAVASAGTSYQVRARLQDGDGNALRWGALTLSASIGDTIADGGTTGTPTIDDATPTLVNGEVLITVTLPAGTYAEGDTITVTISNKTAPDGRTLTGGTSVLTIAADEE